MSANPAPAARPIIAITADDGYIPGVCNIGPWEIRRRWAYGIAGLVAAAALLAVLVAVDAPAIARLLVLLPAWGGMFSVLQARRRFCGGYAFRGVSNFGAGHATVRSVEDEASHRADMVALGRMVRDSLAIALLIAGVAVLLPL